MAVDSLETMPPGYPVQRLVCLIGLVAEGLALVLFAAFAAFSLPRLRSRFRPAVSSWLGRRSFAIACTVVTAIFWISGCHFSINVVVTTCVWGASISSLADLNTLYAVLLGEFSTVILLGDILRVYRSFVVYGRVYMAIAPQGLLLSLSMVAWIGIVYHLACHDWGVARWLILSTHIFSAASNCVCTGSLAITIRKNRAALLSADPEMKPSSDLIQISALLMQSTLAYSLVSLAVIVSFATQSAVFWILHSILTPLVGLDYIVLFIRITAISATTPPAVGADIQLLAITTYSTESAESMASDPQKEQSQFTVD